MAVTGLVTLRSYNQFGFVRANFFEAIEKSGNSIFCYAAINRWMGIRLDMVCQLFGLSVAMLTVLFKNQVEDKSLLAMSMIIIGDLVGVFSITIRMGAEVQNNMTCSQRIYEYTQLKSEDDLEKPGDKALVDNWPSKGEIVFDKVSMKYQEHLEPALVDLTCSI